MSLVAVLVGIIVVVAFLVATLALARKRRRGQQPTGPPPR
jgi:heme/copper-type cytochrome/quinol oxidase subunit 2